MIAKLVLALIGLSLAAAVPAHPESHRVFGVGGFVGYSKAADSEDGAYHVGGNLSLRPFPFLGALAEIGYRKDELDVEGDFVDEAEVEYIPVLLSLQVFPFRSALEPLAPYAIGGAGWYVTRTTLKARLDGSTVRLRDHGVDTGWHFGAGTDLHLGKHLALGGDLRWVWLETELEDVDDADTDGIWVTGGLKFFF